MTAPTKVRQYNAGKLSRFDRNQPEGKQNVYDAPIDEAFIDDVTFEKGGTATQLTIRMGKQYWIGTLFKPSASQDPTLTPEERKRVDAAAEAERDKIKAAKAKAAK